MNTFEIICRFCVGGNFLFFGVMAFFRKPPPPASEKMESFIRALQEARFVMPVVKGIEVLAGAALLVNFLPALALICLSPIVFVILGAHLTLNLQRGWAISLWTALPFFGLWLFHLDLLQSLVKTTP